MNYSCQQIISTIKLSSIVNVLIKAKYRHVVDKFPNVKRCKKKKKKKEVLGLSESVAFNFVALDLYKNRHGYRDWSISSFRQTETRIVRLV